MGAATGKESAPYRVLLAEDDPVSQAFLCEAIRACGGEPRAYADGALALADARRAPWNLLILDRHLPSLDGDAVLASLRAAGIDTPALATTAEPDCDRAALLRAGFAEVLPKPLPFNRLRTALRRHGCRPRVLDDADALRACGSPAVVARLRDLFIEQELPRVQHELHAHGADPQALRPTLHRLRAACGFCGATALAHATASLDDALTGHADASRVEAARAAFGQALEDTRTALHAQLDNEGRRPQASCEDSASTRHDCSPR